MSTIKNQRCFTEATASARLILATGLLTKRKIPGHLIRGPFFEFDTTHYKVLLDQSIDSILYRSFASPL